jgi:hypothetical protein
MTKGFVPGVFYLSPLLGGVRAGGVWPPTVGGGLEEGETG